jgi:hypothetical protein
MTKIVINSPAGGGGGSGTVTSVAATVGNSGSDVNITGSPITTSGTLVINIPVASSGATGKLNSTDWSNFNNKQAPLVSGSNIKTINGSSILGSGDLVVTGLPSGTDGQVQYNNGGAFGGASALFYDDTLNFVGVGTTSPGTKLDVDGSSAVYSQSVRGSGVFSGMTIRNTGTQAANRGTQLTFSSGPTLIGAFDSAYNIGLLNESAGAGSYFIEYWNGSSYAVRLIVLSSGNVGIGTLTPVGLLHLKKSGDATRFVIDGDAGQNRLTSYRTAGVQRWGLYCNNAAESGSNAGSNFVFRRYNDAGTLLGTPISITRSTGQTTISEGLTLAGSELKGFKAAISTLSSIVIDSSNAANLTGTVFVCSGASVTIDASVPNGFNLSVIQQTSTQTVISVTGGLTIRNRQGHTATAGQYATVTLLKQGSDLYLGGDTA